MYSPAASNPFDQRGVRLYSVLDPLPPVCVTHGRPAIGEYEATIQFDGTERHTVWTRLVSGLVSDRHGSTIAGADSEADSVVHVKWPICRRCRLCAVFHGDSPALDRSMRCWSTSALDTLAARSTHTKMIYADGGTRAGATWPNCLSRSKSTAGLCIYRESRLLTQSNLSSFSCRRACA